MHIKYPLIIGLCVAATVATSSVAIHYRSQAARFRQELGSALAQMPALAPATDARSDEPAAADPVDVFAAESDETAESAHLKARIMELERQLADKGPAATSAAVTNAAAAPAPEQDQPRRRRPDVAGNAPAPDPARVEEWQRRRQEMIQSIQNAWTQQVTHLQNRDTSKMSEEDRAEYSQMVSLLNDTWALTRRMQSGVPPEERRQVMSNMHSNIMVLTPLLNNERDRELYDMAMGLGHSDADAASVVQYVNQIVSNTSVRTLIPGGGRGGFHPPGGGNPFGR